MRPSTPFIQHPTWNNQAIIKLWTSLLTQHYGSRLVQLIKPQKITPSGWKGQTWGRPVSTWFPGLFSLKQSSFYLLKFGTQHKPAHCWVATMHRLVRWAALPEEGTGQNTEYSRLELIWTMGSSRSPWLWGHVSGNLNTWYESNSRIQKHTGFPDSIYHHACVELGPS